MPERAGRRPRRVVVVVTATLALWFLTHVTVVVADGLRDDAGYSEVGVVLGNKVEPDGQPSTRLRARLDRAVDLYADGRIDLLVVSGGTGVEGYDEAAVMQAYLERRGIPAGAIITDGDGYTTHRTAQNTRALQQRLGFESVTVISQYHHVSRAKLAFRKVGFEEVRSVSPRYVEVRDLYAVAREFVAYYRYLLR